MKKDCHRGWWTRQRGSLFHREKPALADPDTGPGATSMQTFGYGSNLHVCKYVSQYLTYISSLEGAKVYSQTGWGGARPDLAPALDPPLWTNA